MVRKNIENKVCMDCIYLMLGVPSGKNHGCMKIRGRFDYNKFEFVENRMKVMPSRKACEFFEDIEDY